MGLNGLTVLQWDTAFGIYVTSGLNSDMARVYCSMKGVTVVDACKNVFELRYLAEKVEDISELLSGTGRWSALKQRIDLWMVEYNVNAWIVRLNEIAGVAPGYGEVFEKYKKLCSDLGQRCDGYDCPDTQRKWVQRFLSKWSASRGVVRTHESEGAMSAVRKAPEN